MPITYATPELREMMEQNNNTQKPNRRSLIYHVTCPVSAEPCQVQECEYQPCVASYDADSDVNNEKLEPMIHITAIPKTGQPHPTPPIAYGHQWIKSVVEATFMMDKQRLEELDEIQKTWLGPKYDNEARTVLVDALKTLTDITSESSVKRCATCGKEHLSPHSKECPGCQRLLDPKSERQECPGRTKVQTS